MSTHDEARLFRSWMDAFDEVYAQPSLISQLSCPTCGATDLQIVFVGDRTRQRGYAYFWSNACLTGVFTSRIVVPAGFRLIPKDLPADELNAIVPNFTVIPAIADDEPQADS